MTSRFRSFNIYFAFFSLLLLMAGCASDQNPPKEKRKNQLSTIRLYLEGQRADRITAGTVMVTSNKFFYTIERDPFLSEEDLTKASIVEDAGGSFSIQLAFNEHGALLLDMYTTDHKGKHIIVFTQFPTPGKKGKKAAKAAEENDSDLVESSSIQSSTNTAARQSGWVAAVLVRDRISNGRFRFTPDASRAEANRIVRGLRNVIAKQKRKEEF